MKEIVSYKAYSRTLALNCEGAFCSLRNRDFLLKALAKCVGWWYNIGLDASVSIFEIGYEGRFIEISASALTAGATCLWEDGKFIWGTYGGWIGFSISIDLAEIFKLLYEGE